MKKEAMLYEKLDGGIVNCRLCAHHCRIAPGHKGLCGVRENTQGILNTLVYAEPVAMAVDPIEKKPLFHFLPGTYSYSIATRGCNFKCGFCQNWQISQDRDLGAKGSRLRLSAQEVVEKAKNSNCESISYTYTEPTIFFEYAYDIARLAKEEEIKNVFVTNGYMTKEALEIISPYLDAANIDLKSFKEEFYTKECRGSLQPVLDSIKLAKKLNIWIEVTTLLISGENDSEKELVEIAGFIAGVGKEIPWHISRFHPNYNFLNHEPTPFAILQKAKSIGESAGLRYIYLGNVPNQADTYCPCCGKLLVSRTYFEISQNNIKNGKCRFCRAVVDGIYQ